MRRSLFAHHLFLMAVAVSVTIGRVEGVLTRFEVKNACAYTVWPGLLTGSGGNPAAMEEGRSPSGFMLRPQESATVEVPHGWSGRLWGRVGCNFTSDGVGTCQSGDCGGRLQCGAGVGATPPASLVEFSVQGLRSAKDFYDVSLVDGFNLPISVTPGALPSTTATANRTSCGVASCGADLNNNCPSQLQVIVDNKVVSCKSACLALKSDQYCCSGAFSNPNTCKPSSYSKLFKAACPNAYTYAYDDPSSLFTCNASNYTITFCPSSKSQSSGGQKKDPCRLWAYVGIMSLFVHVF